VLTEALAQELGYDGDATELSLAAVLHDIGKIRVHDTLLSSPGALTDEDWELMKRHTVWGSEFLAGLTDLKLAATIAQSHHERWDGTGYPDGLSGEEIPVAATIVAVADSLDAITSDRPYRRARSIDAAVQELAACSGAQFNPAVIDALLGLHDKGLVRQLREATLNQPKAA
jgi:putative two-component system response regulator